MIDDLPEREIADLIKSLGNQYSQALPEKFITFARFPNFKNLELNSEIKFKFPLSVFIGPNGTGKSSILHALYGMPKNSSTSTFWFSTSLDAIEEGGDFGAPRYWYRHVFNGQEVETRKSRVTRVDRHEEYWEPTKPTLKDGMQKVAAVKQKQAGRTGSRWDPVERNVLFLSFKGELSAYDQFMYFGRHRTTATLKTKQDVIRRDSNVLKRVVSSLNVALTYFGRKVASTARKLNEPELSAVQYILGRQYISATFIRHRLFGGIEPDEGLSVIFEKTGLSYSEAHAGSGEVAVVSAVIQILQMPKESLILLDEPEVSLHPGAQRRLLQFLLKQIQVNKHQMMLSSHSPEFVRGLPKTAINVMSDNGTGRFEIVQNVPAGAAFISVGAPVPGKLTVYVEDPIAEVVVNAALKFHFSAAERKLVSVQPSLGGSQHILCRAVPIWMEQQANVLALLDGDSEPPRPVVDPDSIPIADNSSLGDIISDAIRGEPVFGTGGSHTIAGQQMLIDQQRAYLKWYRKNVRFLPRKCPELIIIDAVNAMENSPPCELTETAEIKAELKAKSGLSDEEFENAAEIRTAAKMMIAKAASHSPDLAKIAAIIRPLLEGL
jgi:predicted ATPase